MTTLDRFSYSNEALLSLERAIHEIEQMSIGSKSILEGHDLEALDEAKRILKLIQFNVAKEANRCYSIIQSRLMEGEV